MGPVRQNQIQKTVMSVHMCVHCTVLKLLHTIIIIIIIIIIQHLYSALKSFKGYGGAGGFRLRLSEQVCFEVFFKGV